MSVTKQYIINCDYTSPECSGGCYAEADVSYMTATEQREDFGTLKSHGDCQWIRYKGMDVCPDCVDYIVNLKALVSDTEGEL